MKHRKFRFSFVCPRAGGMATSHSWGDGQRAAKGQPKGSQRRCLLLPRVGRFLVLSFVASDKGGFCVPCAVLRASCAPGGPEQKQRRRRLARPERPRCPISALRQADGETVFSAASRPDAARARLARPRAATHAERAHKTRSVLSKKDRTAVVFLVSQAIAAATWAEEFAVSYPRNDRTASISAGAGVIPRWCYIILYCSGWCGTDAVGAGRAAGRGALYGVPGVQRGDV